MEAIDRPQIEFKSPIEIFEIAYKHEQYVTKLINELMEVAIKENDHAAKSFLNWYIDEQVEEEASMDKILNQLKMIGGKGQGMLMLDKELAGRIFTPPAQ